MMSDQDDPTERDLAQAVEAVLGPPEGSDSDLLRPIERENVRGYIVEQKRVFATGGRAAAAAQMRDRQTRLENGIAHLPLGHPYREKPEARITELKAQLDELHAQPIDCAGISIDTAVYRHTHRDLSAAEEPAQADRTGQSTEPTDDRLADGSQSEKNLALVSVPGAAGPSIPAPVPEPAIGENEQAGIRSGSLSREERLQAFIRAHPETTFADIKYSASVHTSEFQAWRHDRLKQQSVMSGRIEDVLRGATQLKKKPPKARTD